MPVNVNKQFGKDLAEVIWNNLSIEFPKYPRGLPEFPSLLIQYRP